MIAALIVIILILANALYVAAEFSAVGVRRSRIREAAENGNPLARGLLPILESNEGLDRYIAGCQVGITISSLVLGAYGQAVLAEKWTPLFSRFGGLDEVAAHSAAVTAILILLTALQVLLGELVPKSLALQFPARVALWTSLPMRWSQMLLSWFISVLNGSGTLLLKAAGLPPGGHRHIHSPDEIEMLIADSHDGGLLEPDEQQRLRQALRLGSATAEHLMVPRRFVAGIDAETTPEEALRISIESPYTHLPVYKESLDNVLGILHTKDLVARFVETGSPPTVVDLVRPLEVAPNHITADRLLGIMRERRCHQIALLDEYGGFAGLVTLGDLMAEIFGDVADEFKSGGGTVERLPDGRARAPGLMRLDELESATGVAWESEANTVAGHVLWSLGRLPSPGECVVIDGVQVEIGEVDEKSIKSIIVKLPEAPTEEQ